MRNLLQRLRAFGTSLAQSAPVRWALAHKRAIAITVLVVTFVAIVVYVIVNPQVIGQVVGIGAWNMLWLLLLYTVIIVTHFVVLTSSVSLCGKSIGNRAGFLLTVYSTVANFFGPLQSGPGVRAIYLKSRIGVRIRDFTMASLLYYLAFGATNASLLFIRTMPWLTVLGCAAGVIVIGVVLWRIRRLQRGRFAVVLSLVAASQALVMGAIFFVELNAVGASVDAWQALVYAGSANLSLFVSITPGAIGFREAFVVFTSAMHEIPIDQVVAAGIVDRAFYVLFLGALFAASSLAGMKSMFAVSERPTESGSERSSDA